MWCWPTATPAAPARWPTISPPAFCRARRPAAWKWIAWDQIADTLRDIDLVVNATSAGLGPDAPAVLPARVLHDKLLVLDTVYGAGAKAFRAEVEAAGARGADGLGMLLHQGAAAFALWTGREAPLETMREALHSAFSASRG